MRTTKIFRFGSQEVNVSLRGSFDEPLFNAKDIGNILDIEELSNNILDTNECFITRKCVLDIDQDTEIYESLRKWLYKPFFEATIQKKNATRRPAKWIYTTQWLRQPIEL